MNNENWIEVCNELTKTNIKGLKELLLFLDTSDFRTAPASTKYHLNVEGGLMQHSLNVLKFARDVNGMTQAGCEDKSIILAALLHDACKINYYCLGEEWDKEWKDKTNQWRKKSVYKIADGLPLGHGEKSVIVVSKYIELTDEEMAAIRWHMLKWDCGEANANTMRDAMDKYPLLKVIAIADQMAEHYETMGEKRKAGQQNV